jgi:phenylacetate-CoA oxygenase PaaJ subunit
LISTPYSALTPLEDRVWLALAEIDDPEMPINLVDLGVIYDVEARQGSVRVELTFTAMGCPASDMIVSDIRERLLREPGVEDVDIEVVWDPPWSSARLTPEGRATLHAWGLSI